MTGDHRSKTRLTLPYLMAFELRLGVTRDYATNFANSNWFARVCLTATRKCKESGGRDGLDWLDRNLPG